jgi:hypothetical protein
MFDVLYWLLLIEMGGYSDLIDNHKPSNVKTGDSRRVNSPESNFTLLSTFTEGEVCLSIKLLYLFLPILL